MKHFYLPFLTLLLATFSGILIEPSFQAEVPLGELQSCAHGVKGKVVAVDTLTVRIDELEYDGEGPATWFHGMHKPATEITSADKTKYDTISTDLHNCDRFPKGTALTNQAVTLKLPQPIDKYETIGLFCYFGCNNFGYIKIPMNLTGVDQAPATAATTPACPPGAEASDVNKMCDPTTMKVKNGMIGPTCADVGMDPVPSNGTTSTNTTNPTPGGTTTTTEATGSKSDVIQMTSVWLILSMFLFCKKF